MCCAQVSAAKGDYTMKQSRTFSFQYVYSVVFGMQQAAITWVSSCLLYSLHYLFLSRLADCITVSMPAQAVLTTTSHEILRAAVVVCTDSYGYVRVFGLTSSSRQWGLQSATWCTCLA